MSAPAGRSKSRRGARLAPWRPQSRTYSHPPIVGLHEEIEECYEWLKETDEEENARDLALSELIRLAKRKWPAVLVEVIGSFGTGLTLPTSDVDVVMFGGWETAPLHTTAELLAESGFCDPSKTVVVDAARVPVVKVVHASTRVKLDVSFNQLDGLKSSELIARFIRQYPLFPKIYLIVKQMLVRRNLNECFLGGVSSFSLALMVIFFFQRLEEEKSPPRTNLGVLLMEFFEFYVYEFDFTKHGIDVKRRAPVPKPDRTGSLYIVNPVKPNDQVAASTKLINLISDGFSWAFSVLSAEMSWKSAEPDRTNGEPCFRGILHELVKIDKEALQWRSTIKAMHENHMLVPVARGPPTSSESRRDDRRRKSAVSSEAGPSKPRKRKS